MVKGASLVTKPHCNLPAICVALAAGQSSLASLSPRPETVASGSTRTPPSAGCRTHEVTMMAKAGSALHRRRRPCQVREPSLKMQPLERSSQSWQVQLEVILSTAKSH
ncbi:hypothetical protein CONLIGDRAFT_136903 [Coniochaeta ligniaria NRRL 30616]|uniref:Uncharacterized protein n=1 Tax=Coniochaeta ligniaria NRRL 30616 TaxID=1408157 RepID=A0A1J7I7J4_9PEZI|nr:hypothetical protein CONLIGDRAFT_136903 [Coniochaeta ligniaria NRRL 30616]